MDVHLRDLRYFVAVAEELNFTRAARRLSVSQPALSKQIQALETALHTQLLQRNRREVKLTAAGNALLESARPLLGSWDGITATIAEAASRDARVLRVGTLTSIGRALYPGVVDLFAAHQPGWRVELRSFEWGDPTAGLRDRVTDAAFLWLPIDADEIAYEILVTEPRVLAISTKHPLARRPSVTFADIADEPLLALPESAGPLRDFWLATDQRGGQPAKIAAEVTTADETYEIVAAGAAAHLMAEGNAAIYARPGITWVPVDDLDPAHLSIAWRRDDQRAPVRALVQACLDAVAHPHTSTFSDEPREPATG
jgi:DNA-binding transcriptional LysR family regulator